MNCLPKSVETRRCSTTEFTCSKPTSVIESPVSINQTLNQRDSRIAYKYYVL